MFRKYKNKDQVAVFMQITLIVFCSQNCSVEDSFAKIVLNIQFPSCFYCRYEMWVTVNQLKHFLAQVVCIVNLPDKLIMQKWRQMWLTWTNLTRYSDNIANLANLQMPAGLCANSSDNDTQV